MATHAQIAADLLRNAATFFRDLGGENAELREQMEVNARTYDTVADMVEKTPMNEMVVPSENVDA